jgi:hypothetical protein
MKKIHLHIDQLSLPGYTPAERRTFVAALERELAASAGNATTPHSANRDALRVSTADRRPESAARNAIAGLNLGGKAGGGKP